MQEAEKVGLMNLLLFLRLLFGWIAPPWNEVVPLAVRRDGRLAGRRLEPPQDPPVQREPTRGRLLLLWRAIVRAVGRWCCCQTGRGAAGRGTIGRRPGGP